MSKRPETLFLSDISDSIDAIQSFVKEVDFDQFRESRLIYSATIREFQIIGEAVGKLASSTKKSFPDIPWRDIKDFRNVLVHEYFGIDSKIIWDAIHLELPKLKLVITELLSQYYQSHIASTYLIHVKH